MKEEPHKVSRRPLKSIGIFALIIIAVFGIAIFLTRKDSSVSPAKQPYPTVRRPAPNFTLSGLDGKTVSLTDYRGKVVLLNIWATWCPSCVEELPPMEKFSEGRKEQLVILMAAIDGEKEKKVRRLIKDKKITVPVLLDLKAKTARSYGVNFVPVSFFINREGLIVGTLLGERDWVSPKAWSAVTELFDLR